MSKFKIAISLFSVILGGSLYGQAADTDVEKILEPQTLSKALGHTLAKNLMDTPTFNFDVNSVVEGMQDELEGRPSPLTDAEYERAFDIIHQRYLDEMSTANLNQAESFLNLNMDNPGIIEIIPGKC